MHHCDGFACKIQPRRDHLNFGLRIPGKEYKKQATDKSDDI